MSKVKVYNQKGEEVKELELNPKIFGIKPKQELIHQVAVAQRAGRRQTLAHTKDRSEVRGGGRKPWRQKGTGRARHGSSRSPIWVGGGVTFGPRKERVFKQKINKKMRTRALFMVLTDKAENKKIIAVDSLKLDKIKTKDAKTVLDKLPFKGKKVLIVLPQKNEILVKSFKNIPNVNVMRAADVNVLDLLTFQNMLMAEKSFEVIEKTFLKK